MAQLAPLTLVAPGTLGLNKEQEFTLLDQRWATKALNMVFDRSGRLAARKGYEIQNTGGTASVTLQRVHEFVKQDGTVETIASGAAKIFRVPGSADLSSAANDITSTTVPSDGEWKFLNFNNKCVGVQSGETPIVYTGTGDFTDISPSSGTLPTGGAGCAAFGRLWIVDSDGQTIKYCALLDEADWGGTDAGSFDMSSVWTSGTDEVVAIEAFGANLIVFGKRHIIIWTSEGGSEIGLIPTEMYVADTIEGTGCLARDSIQVIGEGDVLFLSRLGIQSLTRVISQKNNPVATLTKNIRGYLNGYILSETSLLDVTSSYSPENGFYLLHLPSSNKTMVLDTRRIMQDELGDLVCPITEWQHTTTINGSLSKLNGDILFALGTDVVKYTGNSDNNSAYQIQYDSAWLKLDPNTENQLKILKEIRSLVLVSGSPTVLWTWNFDFGLQGLKSYSVDYVAGSGSEYGIAKYNVDEYAGGLEVFQKRIPGAREGQYIRVGLTTSINNSQFVLQQITIFPKLGRMT